MPKALFEKMLAAKNFQSALQLLRQIEFSVMDMALHSQSPSAHATEQTVQQVKNDISVLSTPAFCRPLHSFGHIFAGGYAAGYYSYKWAEVLSADAFAQIEEEMGEQGQWSAHLGERYRQQILEVGGSRKAMDSFIAFRGREPQIQALLRHQGLEDSLA